MATNNLIVELPILDKDFKEKAKPFLDKHDCIKNTGLSIRDSILLAQILYYYLTTCDDRISFLIFENGTQLRTTNEARININYDTFQSALIDVIAAYPSRFNLKFFESDEEKADYIKRMKKQK